MKIIRLLSKFMVFGIMVAVVFVVAPSVCLGNGAGPEPGEFCGDPDIKLTYFPPPFIGNVTLALSLHSGGGEWDDGTPHYAVDIKPAVIYQVGNTTCRLDIFSLPEFWIIPVNESKFADSKPSDFRQICLQDHQFKFVDCGPDYEGIAYVEVVGVGHLIYDEVDKSSTAQFVVMPIE